MSNVDSDLIRGNIDTIILKTMLEEDKYGLDIIKEVENKSNGTYELKQPTLYSCLKRLENQELISSYWLDSDIGGRRHYYKLTDKGREFYNNKQEEWAKSKFIIDNLLSNYNNEEYRLVKKDEYDQILQEKEKQLNNENYIQNQQIIENENNYDNENSLEGSDNTTIANENQNALNNNSFFNLKDDFETQEDNLGDNLQDSLAEDGMEINDFQENLTSENNEFTHEEDIDSENSEISQEDIDSENNEIEQNDTFYFNEDNNVVENHFQEQQVCDDDKNAFEKSEENFLSKLDDQNEQEINEYYGDKQTYVNQLNHIDHDIETKQNDLFDNIDSKEDEIAGKIDEFNNSITKLSQFNSPEENEDSNEYANNNLNFLQELESLSQNKVNNFINSNEQVFENDNNLNSYELENNDLINEKQENENFNTFEENNNFYQNVNNDNVEEFVVENNDDDISTTEESENLNFSNNFDDIIAKNVSSIPTNDKIYNLNINSGYKQKLSTLSKYSQMSIQNPNNNSVNDIKISKIKFENLKSSLENEGINLKEFSKINSIEQKDKNYLLVNKINLIKSLIMCFGYIFILSAVYIILSKMPFKDTLNFSFKYFVYGFMPFGIILIYRFITYLVDPYKKTLANISPRIMFFISFIITIQLLLITYCFNLQIGFYSFSQINYNHLLWIVPTIVSFAPLISTIIYMILFYSRNFNV